MNKLVSNFKNRIYIALILITLVAGFLRFYKLAEVPVSLYWDEVATGYNAFSVANTFKDEYGTFLPILFRSYNDYKMPLNVYLTAIPVKIFGLNEFSVRFPSALFGTLTVFITFFLVRTLLNKKIIKKGFLNSDIVALLSAFFLAISPWHIQFCRGSFEANIALFFVVTGTFLFLKGINKYPYFLLSLVSYAIACYGYRSVQVFLPIFIFCLFLIWKKEIFRLGLIKIAISLILFFMLISPLILPLSREGSSRFQQTSITNKVNEEAMKDFQNGKSTNRKLLYGKIFLENYLTEVSPIFLFVSGDLNGRHSARGMGLLYFWEVPFILIGIYVLIKKTTFQIAATVGVWLLAFPVAAALSIPAPHALRTLNVLPLPQIITAVGIIYLLNFLPKKITKTFVFFVSLLIFLFFMNFIYLYKSSNTRLVVSQWGDGYKQLMSYISTNEKKYDRIIISGHYWQPYMYVLFYSKFNPAKYQQAGTPGKFDKYIFGGTSWDLAVGRPELNNANLKELAHSSNVLVALSPEEYKDQSQNVTLRTIIRDHNGKVVFIVGEVK